MNGPSGSVQCTSASVGIRIPPSSSVAGVEHDPRAHFGVPSFAARAVPERGNHVAVGVEAEGDRCGRVADLRFDLDDCLVDDVPAQIRIAHRMGSPRQLGQVAHRLADRGLVARSPGDRHAEHLRRERPLAAGEPVDDVQARQKPGEAHVRLPGERRLLDDDFLDGVERERAAVGLALHRPFLDEADSRGRGTTLREHTLEVVVDEVGKLGELAVGGWRRCVMPQSSCCPPHRASVRVTIVIGD